MNTQDLTTDTLALFLELAKDAGNWNGMPLLAVLTPAEKGNLTDLKKKGLVKIEKEDGSEWVIFSVEGLRLAVDHGIDFEVGHEGYRLASEIVAD